MDRKRLHGSQENEEILSFVYLLLRRHDDTHTMLLRLVEWRANLIMKTLFYAGSLYWSQPATLVQSGATFSDPLSTRFFHLFLD